MSIIVPHAPLAAHLTSTSPDRPIVVRAHARRTRAACAASRPACVDMTTGEPVPARVAQLVLAQRARVERARDALNALDAISPRHPGRESAWDRVCVETGALYALMEHFEVAPFPAVA
ncbi:hypothetical protein [Microbacterium sp. No. 7]|uniref:hypothetical protein n=1 Tax=Microbacterium sp. No. 7 TaxID=1714373 RepID=UPI0006D08718|nr:hypothetical protein [Microbacterium sp. No. 7]ALJ19515.1 hypothetical protein AOA12_06175 [Microbacterium sp. No. 7]